MTNVVKFGDAARNPIKEGIDIVADVVKVTLGPRGRNVILDTNPYGPPLITNDGVTIARELAVKGKLQNTGAKLVREVAGKTNDIAGDGTTTASVLVQAIITEALKSISTGADAVSVRKGIECAAEAIIATVEAEKTVVSDLPSLTAIATISCGNADLGALVAEMVHKVGAEGLVTLEDNPEPGTESELSEGLELRGGFNYPIFVNNPARQQAVIDKVPVFVTNHALTNGLEVVKIMEAAAANGHKAAVVIANSIEGEALASCVVNWAQQKFQLLPVRVVAYGASGEGALRDVAAVTGATYFAKEEGHKLPMDRSDSIDFANFGIADRVVATKDRTTIIGGAGDADARIDELKSQLPNLKDYEKESVKERIGKLQSGVGIIKVGGATDTEREERKLRIEDAINATKAALTNGVVSGGGVALYRASEFANLDTEASGNDADYGFDAVIRAAKAPFKQIALNSSVEVDRSDLVKVLNDKDLTIDFNTGEVVNAHKAGVLDPALVVVSALRYAASTAAMFITAEASVTGDEDESEKV